MNRAISLTLALLVITAALPAAAQESGGLRLRNDPLATLGVIDTNRGCPLSKTSVTLGVNKAFARGLSTTQQLNTVAGPTGSGGCRPLVSTQVAAGVNLSFGSGSGRPVDQRPQSAQAAGNHQLHARGQSERRRRVCCNPTDTEPDQPMTCFAAAGSLPHRIACRPSTFRREAAIIGRDGSGFRHYSKSDLTQLLDRSNSTHV
jgi:hypothetical protein